MIYTEALEPGGDQHYPYLIPFYKELTTLLPKVNGVITQSIRVKTKIIDTWGVDEEKIFLVPWVVDVPQSNLKKEKTNLDRITFGSAGRIAPEKDVYTFLDAAKLLVDKYPDQVKILVAGGGPLLDDVRFSRI